MFKIATYQVYFKMLDKIRWTTIEVNEKQRISISPYVSLGPNLIYVSVRDLACSRRMRKGCGETGRERVRTSERERVREGGGNK